MFVFSQIICKRKHKCIYANIFSLPVTLSIINRHTPSGFAA